MFQNHHFHLVNFRPWPLTGTFGLFILLSGVVKLFHNNFFNYIIVLGLLIILLTKFQWWRDIVRERTFQGNHTKKVLIGLKFGILLFIISEFFFFISFFWAFFHSRLSASIELGLFWPPLGILTFDPFKIPLLNTIILLTSGISITWAHYRVLNKNFKQTFWRLFLTIFLGIYFSILQFLEYLEAGFSIADSSYGSSFFIATGFHGLHVLIGTFFILVCLIRQNNFHFSNYHHFGFEAAAWYWHFVDVVWLFLFISIYWWGR